MPGPVTEVKCFWRGGGGGGGGGGGCKRSDFSEIPILVAISLPFFYAKI